MDFGQTFLQLSVPERHKVFEALKVLKDIGDNATSNDSAGKSGTDLKDSVNLSNNTPERSLKQKTLDNWIVKSKTPSSNCEKELAKETNKFSRNFESEEDDEQRKLDKSCRLDIESKTPSSNCEKDLAKETNESSRNFESEENDEQRKLDKSSRLVNESNIYKKKLMVLLNRQDCLESKLKSPDHSKLSPEKKLASPKKIKSPIKKNEHVSENSNLSNLTPEKHSPTPTRSYNLRARGVLEEKISNRTSNSMATSAKCEDSDKIHKPIHKSVTKQKPKSKTAFGKDTSLNSNYVEANYDEKTNSCDERTSEEITKNSECKILSISVQSELEKTSVDSNRITVTDEYPTVVELNPSLAVKGKRKKNCKNKESKKICTSSAIQKSSNFQENAATEEINMDIKSTQYVSSKNVRKLSIENENQSELSIEKTVQLSKTFVDTFASQEQSTNNIVKLVPKIKPNKTTKSKDKNDLILHEKTKLDSVFSKAKKKNSSTQKISSGIVKSIGFQSGVSGQQLDSTKDSESQIKACAKETEKLLTKDSKSLTSVKGDSKKISRKRSSENKCTTTENSSLSDPELISKNNDKDCVTSRDTLSKISPSQNKEFADELLIKETNTRTPINAKKICKKKGSENNSKLSAKNNLVSDSKQVSKTIVEVTAIPSETLSIDSSKNSPSQIPSETLSIDSSKNSPSQRKEFAKDTEEFLMKDADAVTQIDVNSKRIYRKKGSGNKSKAASNLIFNSELAFKNHDKNNIIFTKTSTSSSNSPSQNKKFDNETEELLIKDTTTVTPLNMKSKRTCRKKSNENKSMAATKNSLQSNSEQNFKNNDKDNISVIETSLIDSSNTSTPVIKDISISQINSSATEETVSLNQNNCSKPINSSILSDNHSRKHSKSLDSNSPNELKSLNEMKELLEDHSKKFSAVSPNAPQANDVLHIQEILQFSNASKKVSTVKKKTLKQSPANSKKKLKIAKDENLSNATQSNSDNRSSEVENSGVNLKKNGSKKIITSSKINLGTDSNKEQSEVLIAKSIANSSHSNTVQEPNDQLLKNSKLSNKLSRPQKEKIKVKNSKKVKETHFKKKNNLKSQIVSNTNLSKNDEIEKINCDLVEENSKKNKLCKSISISMVVNNNSESGEENRRIIQDMEEETEKATDFTVNNSNDTDIADTNFKGSFEFDEKMKHNYAAFCEVKEVLGVIGISIDELFENPEMISSLKSITPDGVYFINKCKKDSTVSVFMHESKKELMNTLNKLHKKYSDEAK